ncbi:hypothetical protein ABH932_001429 [Streptacidiphilus sp. MAP5-52]
MLPGGARLLALPTPAEMRAIGEDIGDLVQLALGHPVVKDRFTGTAALPAEAARDLGCLGYVARASGLALDARIMHPALDLGPALHVPTTETGDVLARFQIRAKEIDISLYLIDQLTRRLEPGSFTVPLAEEGPGHGSGLVEGWRGTIATRIELAPDSTLTRVKPVDPSFFNWPALPVALADTIVPDFPLTNKSFNLSYAGNDLCPPPCAHATPARRDAPACYQAKPGTSRTVPLHIRGMDRRPEDAPCRRGCLPTRGQGVRVRAWRPRWRRRHAHRPAAIRPPRADVSRSTVDDEIAFAARLLPDARERGHHNEAERLRQCIDQLLDRRSAGDTLDPSDGPEQC